MAISNRTPEEIRRTVAYRAALWCGRLANVDALAALVLGPIVFHSVTVFVVTVLLGLPLSVGTIGFTLLSGARFVRQGNRWQLDPEIGRNFYRDMWWRPRR